MLHLRSNTWGLRKTTKLIELRLNEALPAEDVRPEPPREVLASLILHMSTRGYSEDVIELFERSLFRLWHPKEANTVLVYIRFSDLIWNLHHDQGEDVQASIDCGLSALIYTFGGSMTYIQIHPEV
jgi:hypothetical protein